MREYLSVVECIFTLSICAVPNVSRKLSEMPDCGSLMALFNRGMVHG